MHRPSTKRPARINQSIPQIMKEMLKHRLIKSKIFTSIKKHPSLKLTQVIFFILKSNDSFYNKEYYWYKK